MRGSDYQFDKDVQNYSKTDAGNKGPYSQAGTCATPDPDYLLNHTFTYHPANETQLAQYAAIRSAAKHLAEMILQNTPASPDRSAAIRKVREAVMTANAAVATNGRTI